MAFVRTTAVEQPGFGARDDAARVSVAGIHRRRASGDCQRKSIVALGKRALRIDEKLRRGLAGRLQHDARRGRLFRNERRFRGRRDRGCGGTLLHRFDTQPGLGEVVSHPRELLISIRRIFLQRVFDDRSDLGVDSGKHR
jgi:hypothetical protein